MKHFTICGTSNIPSHELVGYHDTSEVEWALAEPYSVCAAGRVYIKQPRFNMHPVNQRTTLMEMKRVLLNYAEIAEDFKDDIHGYYPAVFNKFAGRDSDSADIQRASLMLDFDSGADIFYILSCLRNVVFFAWTTYSHMTPDIPKYRVLIPFVSGTAPTKLTWNSHGKHDVSRWLMELGIPINFHGSETNKNGIDPSCLSFSQFGYLPAINPLYGKCELWFNDSAWTKIVDFDADIVGECPTVYDPRIKTDDQNVSQETDLGTTKSVYDLDLIIDSIIANNNIKDVARVDRLKYAAAVRSCGGSFEQWVRLDTSIRKCDTNTTSVKCWEEAESFSKIGVATLISKLTTEQKRRMQYLARKDDLFSAKWDETITLEENFITAEVMEKVLSHKEVVLNGDYGIGKNTFWMKHENTIFDRVVILTPYLSIVGQQSTTEKPNNVDDIKNKVFTYDHATHVESAIQNMDVIPHRTVLIIDEAHNFCSAVYRSEALANMETLIKSHEWKNVIYQSATLQPHSLNPLVSDKVFSIKLMKADPKPVVYTTVIRPKDITENETVFSVVLREVRAGKKVLVLQNHKSNNKALVDHFKAMGISTDLVDRDQISAGNTVAYDLASNARFKMGELSALFGTYSIVEGISIADTLDEAVCVIVGNEHHSYIGQLTGRFRNAKSIRIIHIRSYEAEIEYGSVGYVQYKASVASANRFMLDVARSKTDFCMRQLEHLACSHAGCGHLSSIITSYGVKLDSVTNTYMPTNLHILFSRFYDEMHEFYNVKGIDKLYIESLGFTYGGCAVTTVVQSSEVREATARERKKKRELVDTVIADCARAIESSSTSDEFDMSNYKMVATFDRKVKAIDSMYLVADKLIAMLAGFSTNKKWILQQLRENFHSRADVDAIKRKIESANSQGRPTADIRKVVEHFIAENKNSFLTVDQMKLITEMMVTLLVEERVGITGCSLHSAVELVCKTKRFKKLKGAISVDNGSIVINVSRPLGIIKNDLAGLGVMLTSARQMIDGKQMRVASVNLVDMAHTA